MNILALSSKNDKALNQVYNPAFGEQSTLNELIVILKEFLSKYDREIKNIDVIHGSIRAGDIPHS
jgi:UDP-N-acetylglucosamine 4-epimerase